MLTVSALADLNGKPDGGARPTCRSDVDDTRADFSNFGPDVDLIAPGVHPVHLQGRRLRHPERHLHGEPARGRRGGALQVDAPRRLAGGGQTALQAAGNLNWNASDDPDGIKEKLLNVDAL